MPDPLKGNRDTLPDHCTPDGDKVVETLTIRIHASGALSVVGPIDNHAWALAVLDNARDAINNHHNPQRKGGLIVPGNDVSIQKL